MRINNSSNALDITSTQKEANPATPTAKPISVQAEIQPSVKNVLDTRTSMRTAETGINARMIAAKLKSATDVSLSSITSNLPKYLRSQSDIRQTLLKQGNDPFNPTKSAESKPKSMTELFGNDAWQQDFSGKKKVANAAQAAPATSSSPNSSAPDGASGTEGTPEVTGEESLGAVLAKVGSILVKSINNLLKELTDNAKQLDAANNPTSGGGGGTASLNQKIQQLTFNLQEVQQSLNRVNETLTGLSRSASDGEKTLTQNLSV